MNTTTKDNYIQQQSILNELFSTPVPNVYSNNTSNSKPLYQSSNSNNTSPNIINSFIYVINDAYINNDVEPVVIDPTEGNDENLYAQFALFFTNATLLHIPNKVLYNLTKYTPKALLREIDGDLTVAIEKCLIVLSNLSSTYFNDRWKALSSVILHDQTKNSDTNYVYAKVIDCLLFGTKDKGPMIEILKNKFGKETYQNGVSARNFKITDNYYNAGLTTYYLTTPKLIQQRQKHTFRSLKIANSNIIASNLLELYSGIDYPNESEILKMGKSLCKAKQTNKKGKIYTMRNKHNNSYWKDVSKRSFIEDNIILYKYLTDNGIMIPIPGDVKSGGRVVDSFTLMPSWIRKMIKIDGEEIVEVDYSCLHPNIAMSLYGGTKKYITHQYVSDETGFEKNIIKIEHLSFFNKHQNQMQKSQLYNYYMTSEPTMIRNIIYEKIGHGYKKTSERLFKKEVEIMTEVIRRLNVEGIYVGYVYDALFTTKKHAERVKEVMDKVTIDLLVYTVAVI